jgi:hypothetical protein
MISITLRVPRYLLGALAVLTCVGTISGVIEELGREPAVEPAPGT